MCVRRVPFEDRFSVHYCGWDLAYSTHGWCMVEANCTAQMGGMQIITQTGRKAELEALIAQM